MAYSYVTTSSMVYMAAAGDVDAPILLVSHILKKLNCFHTDEEKNLLTVDIADQLMLVT